MGEEFYTFTLLRKPRNLEEILKHKHRMAIWRDNDTLTYVISFDSEDLPDTKKHVLSLYFGDQRLEMLIVGDTHDAVAETAAFFMELEEATDDLSFLRISNWREGFFDFRAAGPLCFTQMFEPAPLLEVELRDLTLNSVQSAVLASRPHPTRLKLLDCSIEDAGTALVDALQQRETSLGSFSDLWYTSLSDDNLKRLLKIKMIEHLELPFLERELTFLPFSAQMDSLTYNICSETLSQSLGFDADIVIEANKLSIDISFDSGSFPTELTLSILRRLAILGPSELTFSFRGKVAFNNSIPNAVPQELIRAIHANRNLKVLNLCAPGKDWDPHVETLFKCLKDHKGLWTFKINVSDSAFGPDFSHLRELLSHNRYIKVVDESGKVYSDGLLIDKLYSFNSFYRGSVDLAVQPPLQRPLLVATALTESALNDFHRSALLLSDHIDAFYELISFAQLDESHVDGDGDSSFSLSNQCSDRKRSRAMQ